MTSKIEAETDVPAQDEKDACELLDADHIAVNHLFADYARLAVQAQAQVASPPQMQSPDAGDRLAVALQICDEISVHAQVEEEIFYPALRKALGKDADLIDAAEGEHQQAKALVARIRASGRADAATDELVAELNRAIAHHVKEERDELFPKARAMPGLDLGALGDALRARQQELVAGNASSR